MFGKSEHIKEESKTAIPPIAEVKKISKIEPKAVLSLKDAKKISDDLSANDKRLIFKAYGVASSYRNTENGGILSPRFGGNFEVTTPDNRKVMLSKFCYLPPQLQGRLIEELKASGSVEFVAAIYLVKNESRFTGFEYVGEFEVIRKADPIAALRKQVAGGNHE